MENWGKIHFWGAAGTVTGSKFLVETPDRNILIDAGVFQGLKELRLLNWKALPFDSSTIDEVLLTHGHLDHVGYLPKLVQQGFRGRIIGTAPTLAIAQIILRDSAKIHEEEAEKANEEHYSSHSPALPFFTVEEAEETLQYFSPVDQDVWHKLSENIRYRYNLNGHIIGSCFIEMDINDKRLVFSGDVGRDDDILLKTPAKPEKADYLFIESTYGNKLHPQEDVEQILSDAVKKAIQEKGTIIIPSFAVERLQLLMYLLWKMYQQNKIPNIPIFVDSPMGNNVLDVFGTYMNWHKISAQEYHAMCNHVNIITSYKETWKTVDDKRPKIIIAGSGMVTGGRVLTYLQYYIDQPKTQVILVGYQAEGTRGRQLQEGGHELKIYGKYFPVRAKILNIESLSAHGDQNDLIQWISAIENTPKQVFLIHGEPNATNTFRTKIIDTYNWNVTVPQLNDVVSIEL